MLLALLNAVIPISVQHECHWINAIALKEKLDESIAATEWHVRCGAIILTELEVQSHWLQQSVLCT